MSRTPFAIRALANSSLSVARFIKHQTMLSSVSEGPSQFIRLLSFSAIQGRQPVVIIFLAWSSEPADILTKTQLALSCHQYLLRDGYTWISWSPILRRLKTSGVSLAAICIPWVWKIVPSLSDEFFLRILRAKRTLVLSFIRSRWRYRYKSAKWCLSRSMRNAIPMSRMSLIEYRWIYPRLILCFHHRVPPYLDPPPLYRTIGTERRRCRSVAVAVAVTTRGDSHPHASHLKSQIGWSVNREQECTVELPLILIITRATI